MNRKFLCILLALLTATWSFLLTSCGDDKELSETFIQDQELENDVKHNIKKLSKKARDGLNYKELLEDIEAVNNRDIPIYAQPVEDEENRYEIRFDGEGYYCKTFSGGEVVTYVFYSETGDKKIKSRLADGS